MLFVDQMFNVVQNWIFENLTIINVQVFYISHPLHNQGLHIIIQILNGKND